MTTCINTILVKGRYQIVALIPRGEDDVDQINGYLVQTSAGVRLRHELTLDAAKAWMAKRIEEDNIRPPTISPRTGSMRARR